MMPRRTRGEPETDATPETDAVMDAASFGPGARVAVMLPLPLAGAYDYRVPEGLPVAPGDMVRVPLGRRRLVGVVWGPGLGAVAEAKLRPLAEKLDAFPMPEPLRRLVDWVAAYTLSPPGAVLRMALPVPDALEPETPRTAYLPADAWPEGLRGTDARRRVMAVLDSAPALSAAELAQEAGVGTAVVRGLADAGALVPVSRARRTPTPVPDPDAGGPVLSDGQRLAADALAAATRAESFSVHLLDGVTGSGKTEVYFEAVAAALHAGRQVLVLLPEIALTGQWLDRFTRRFGAEPALWHSEMGQARRRDTWRDVAAGRAPVVVGARSALFLPFPDLGLIVVDEEHDPAFKQEDGVAYNARDMAVVRGRLSGAPVIPVSATPSLETVANVEAGRYVRHHLPDRHGGAHMPTVAAVELRL
mgnify:CR=1 FL=1